jgi:iron complex outermembrane recepter protein
MSAPISQRRALCLAASTLALACLAPGAARAQTAAPDSGQEAKDTDLAKLNDAIVVTGTRTGKKVADKPVQMISGDTLNKFGYTNLGDALTTLPIFGTPGNSTIDSQGSFGAGQTFANMYDLGSQRTLTLVNGNRFVSAANGSLFTASTGSPVDLGQIAPDLIDHVDVVSVGGAPIYGSDAIAGTVNIVLKRNFQGLELTGSDGLSGKGDARDYNISLLAGHNFADGRGNLTLNVYFDHQDGLSTAQRELTSSSSPFYGNALGASPYAQVIYQGGMHYNAFTNTGIPLIADSIPFYYGPTGAGVTNAAGQTMVFNQQGHLVPFVNGTQTGVGYVEGGGSGFPVDNYGNLLTDSNRIQATLLGHFDFSDHLRLHGELWLGRNRATNVADQPYYSTNFFGSAATLGNPATYNGNLVFNTSNPYLSSTDRALLESQVGPDGTFYLARANTDLYSGAFTSTSYLFRGIAGLDGDFTVGGHAFKWDATLNFGRNSTITREPQIVSQNFLNAINATTDGNGNIVCAPGYTNATIATLSSTCAPLDVFGLNQASQAAINYITAIAQSHQVNKMLDLVADLKGDVAHLPAGNLVVALGVEIRRESQSFDPGAFFLGDPQADGTYQPYGNSTPITPVSGSYHTHEVFGEVTLPLIGPNQHLPLIHEIALHGAARYTDNTMNGGTWSYTAGGNYAPVGGFTFRGNYTRSFRAPAVTEAFAPNGTAYETATDPCDATAINGGPHPSTRAANCAAAGIPTGFVSNVDNYTATGTISGNPHLQNEEARSWTVGIQANPPMIPGLQLTADYISISIQNEITEPGLTAELDACYDTSDYPNNPYCHTFTRDNSGQIVSFTDNYYNVAVENFRALQVGLSYALPLNRIGLPAAAGTLNIAANYLHTYRHYTKIGDEDVQLVAGKYTDPVDAVTTTIGWQTAKFDWLWTVIYSGPSLVDPNAAANDYQYPRVSPYWMVNTSIGLHVTDHMDLRLTVNNVFNLGVPDPQVYEANSANKYWDAILGRSFRLIAKVKF